MWSPALAKQDEISSTEKLLDLIRDAEPSTPAGSKPDDPESHDYKPPSSLIQSLPFTKKIAIGVEIGYTELKLAKVAHLSEKKIELLDYANIPFEPGFREFPSNRTDRVL